MDSKLIQLKIKLRLNKLDSEDYDNIECWIKREAINKAQLEWVRRQIHGINESKEGDEESSIRVDDLQTLLTKKVLTVNNKGLYFESELIPDNYGWFKSIRVEGTKDGCTDIISDLHHIEEANVNVWLNDWSKQPSFDFRQTFYTLSGNKIRIYTDSDFIVSKLTLLYYRVPQEFDIEGCDWYNEKQSYDVGLEFKDDVCELIIDEAAYILAGDLEHVNAYQAAYKRKEENN